MNEGKTGAPQRRLGTRGMRLLGEVAYIQAPRAALRLRFRAGKSGCNHPATTKITSGRQMGKLNGIGESVLDWCCVDDRCSE